MKRLSYAFVLLVLVVLVVLASENWFDTEKVKAGKTYEFKSGTIYVPEPAIITIASMDEFTFADQNTDTPITADESEDRPDDDPLWQDYVMPNVSVETGAYVLKTGRFGADVVLSIDGEYKDSTTRGWEMVTLFSILAVFILFVYVLFAELWIFHVPEEETAQEV